jgi:medium-chain acyl-[acyl-carrier-protein] hydrolase
MSSAIQSLWTDSYNVYWCDADTKGNASIISLFNYLQESALRNAAYLGLGYKAEMEANQIWVIVRMEMEVKRYPQWGESIMVRTWPRGVENFYALRDYEIMDSEGNLIAAATSRWIIINTISRRPLPMKIMQELLNLCDPRKATTPVLGETRLAGKFVFIKRHSVQYSDLDKHNHVNNTRYVEWVVNAFPFNWLQGHEIVTFRIDYQRESHQDDEVEIYADQPGGKNNWVKVIRIQDQKIIFKAFIGWRVRS